MKMKIKWSIACYSCSTIRDIDWRITWQRFRKDKNADAENRNQEQFTKGISKCSADALSFTLTSLLVCISNEPIDLDSNDIISKRLFCQKIWNGTKLGLQFLADDEETKYKSDYSEPDYDGLSSLISTKIIWVNFKSFYLLYTILRCIFI